MQKNGCSLLYHKGQGQTWYTRPQEDSHCHCRHSSQKVSLKHTHTHAHTHTRTHARSEDKGALNTLLEAVKTNYNERFEDIRKRWGGGIMGRKAQDAKAKQDKIKNREMASKMAA